MDAEPIWAVVPAAGVGRRMCSARPKQYLPLAGRSVIEHSLDRLLRHTRVAGVVVVVGTDDPYWPVLQIHTDKPLLTAPGGAERAQSVLNGLRALAARLEQNAWVLVHDAVRPCLRETELDALIAALADDPVGGLLAVPARDTIKRADARGRVEATEDRGGLWHAQTPQMFRLGLLQRALAEALACGVAVTDEASAVEGAGLAPRLVAGRMDNIKITSPEDLALAEFYLTRACE